MPFCNSFNADRLDCRYFRKCEMLDRLSSCSSRDCKVCNNYDQLFFRDIEQQVNGFSVCSMVIDLVEERNACDDFFLCYLFARFR